MQEVPPNRPNQSANRQTQETYKTYKTDKTDKTDSFTPFAPPSPRLPRSVALISDQPIACISHSGPYTDHIPKELVRFIETTENDALVRPTVRARVPRMPARIVPRNAARAARCAPLARPPSL